MNLHDPVERDSEQHPSRPRFDWFDVGYDVSRVESLSFLPTLSVDRIDVAREKINV